jgi:uncharacterized repeat protein (TIGR01451 family)
MKMLNRQARNRRGLSVRRLAVVGAICALGSVLTLAGSALALVGDGILGTSTAYFASTVCPSGEAVTGVRGDTDSAGAVLAVSARCSGGTDAPAIGSAYFGDAGTACGTGEVGVGIVGVEQSDAESSPLRQLSLRCRASDLGGATSTAVSALGSAAGVADGPYDCPDGQVLTGLTGWVSQFDDLEGIEIQCDSPTSPPPPAVGVSPSSVSFGDQQLGSTSAPQTVTISNTAAGGSQSLMLGQVTLGGSNPGDFRLDNSCSNASLTPGGSCTVDISFSPTVLGSRSATLSVPSNATSSPTMVELLGTGTASIPPPAVGVSPSSIDFGDQLVGSTSGAHPVTVTNAAASGSQSLTLGQLTVGGTNAAEFSLGNDTCSNASLAPGGSCTVDVRFAPSQVGSRSANLNITSNAASSPDSVALSGNGTVASLADVRLTVSGPSSAVNGSQNTYLMNVANAGPAMATGVIVTAQVPAGTKFVGVSTTQGSCTHPASGATSGTIHCILGDLASGATAIDSVALKLALSGKGGSIALVGQVSASTTDPDLSNNVASLTTTLKKK